MSYTGSFLVPAILLLSSVGHSSRCWADSGVDFGNSQGRLSGAGFDIPEALSGGTGEGKEPFSRIPNGVLFAGGFSGPVKWTISDLNHGTHSYTFSELPTASRDGKNAIRITEGATIKTGKEYFKDAGTIPGNDSAPSSSVPEPSTWAMMEIGILILASGVCRKAMASR